MYLLPGLTPEAASQICRLQCRARCCRGPQFLSLTPDEAKVFVKHAVDLGVIVRVREASGGGGQVRFLEHEGEHCPMLDDATSVCRIYGDRPSRCREFPEKPRPGCAISCAPET
jgi:Fe-S-cluster containining protein